MVNPNLLTIFVALTAVAVVIQTGILVGFYLVSLKLSRQADRAIEASSNVLGPLETVAGNLQVVSGRIAEFGSRWRRRAA